MILFKLLFLFGIASVELPEEEIGWVPVEQSKEETPLGADETDPSIWVVFAKEVDGEKFLISFPAAPTYKYLKADGSELELRGTSYGSEHTLQVVKVVPDLLKARKESLEGAIHFLERSDETGVEIVYWKGGYWFMEKLVSSGKHSYVLQTKNIELESQMHGVFVASFNIEK